MMVSIPVIVLAAICSTAVSAQSDTCYQDFNGLFGYKIEEQVNSTLRERLTTLVPELTQNVTSMVEQRIAATVNNTLNTELGNRIAAGIMTALANEPGEICGLLT